MSSKWILVLCCTFQFLAAQGIGVVAPDSHGNVEEQKAAAALDDLGAFVRGFNDAKPGGRRFVRLAGPPGLKDLQAALPHLRKLPNLQSLDLSSCKVTDEDLALLAHTPGLTDLELT